MRTLWRFASQSVYIPLLDAAQDTYHALKASGRALFFLFSLLLLISTFGLLFMLNSRLITAVPGHGGSLTEGIVGSPRFINPILAISDADHDAVALVYSGLLHATPEGAYVPDLASGYEISDDGKTYTFHLRENAIFHDGVKVTADDIVFTVAKTQTAALKSPVQANWDGIVVEKVDEKTVRFTLKSSYAPFIENLTLGILPKHLWENVSDEEFPFSNLNTSPVGSGPFRVASVSRSASGIPASYDLRPFKEYALGEPYLARLMLRFYQNEPALISALESNDINAASGISPSLLKSLGGYSVERSPLNRVFGIFFNQNQSEVLRDTDVREALQDSIDRQALIDQVLAGFGVPLTSPVPPTVVGGALSTASSAASNAPNDDLALAAQAQLVAHGWKLGEDGVLTKTTGKGDTAKTMRLAFTLATGNVPELRAAAEFAKKNWEKMGAEVTLQIFDQGDLSQNVIRPRKYDALLFGEVIGRELDLYAFWHSSQRNDPGLNIALYANKDADTILEQLRATRSEADRIELYKKFEGELAQDVPAVFLYAPDFVYIVGNSIKGIDLGFIGSPSDRYLSVAQWHRETEYVWPIFVSKTPQ